MPDEKWTDIFPQLIIPAAVGVGATFSPWIARGANTAMGTASVIGGLQEQFYNRKMKRRAAEEMQAAIDPLITQTRQAQQDFIHQQDLYRNAPTQQDLEQQRFNTVMQNAEQWLGDTGSVADYGPVFATSPADLTGHEGEKIHDDLNAQINFQMPDPPAGQGMPSLEGTPGFDQLSEKIYQDTLRGRGITENPNTLDVWGAGQTPYDARLANMQIQRAAAMAEPGTAGYSLGQMFLQQQGAGDERDRMAWQAYYNSRSAQERHRLDVQERQVALGNQEALMRREDDRARARQQFVNTAGGYGTWSQSEGLKMNRTWDPNATPKPDPLQYKSSLRRGLDDMMRNRAYAVEMQDQYGVIVAESQIADILAEMKKLGMDVPAELESAPGAGAPTNLTPQGKSVFDRYTAMMHGH